MMSSVFAGIGAFSQPQAVVVVALASVLLLLARASRDVVGLDLTRRALIALDGAIIVLLVLFVALVVLRFKTLA